MNNPCEHMMPQGYRCGKSSDHRVHIIESNSFNNIYMAEPGCLLFNVLTARYCNQGPKDYIHLENASSFQHSFKDVPTTKESTEAPTSDQIADLIDFDPVTELSVGDIVNISSYLFRVTDLVITHDDVPRAYLTSLVEELTIKTEASDGDMENRV